MRQSKEKAFTLVELLVVMAVIIILAGLVLSLIPFINKKQARSRAEGEIKGMMAALEAYKADNGAYPDDANVAIAGSYTKGYTDTLDARANGDPTQTVYVNAGLVLYRALSGDRNLNRSLDTTGSTDNGLDLDGNALATPLTVPTVQYFPFNASQLLPAGGTGTVTGLIDPYGYSYGYSTAYQGDVSMNNANGTTTAPTHGYNPTYDLWSTAGTVSGTADTAATTQIKRAQWIYNWQNSGANVGQ